MLTKLSCKIICSINICNFFDVTAVIYDINVLSTHIAIIYTYVGVVSCTGVNDVGVIGETDGDVTHDGTGDGTVIPDTVDVLHCIPPASCTLTAGMAFLQNNTHISKMQILGHNISFVQHKCVIHTCSTN
jgi:hypothetical protein